MENQDKPKLYQEEFKNIFRRGAGVKYAVIVSAFIEGQIFSLAQSFLEKRGVIHKPAASQEYYQSLNVLGVNNFLNTEELEELKKFRTERNKAIHGPFKGMTRPEWEKQNERVIETGKPIIEKLDRKLYPHDPHE